MLSMCCLAIPQMVTQSVRQHIRVLSIPVTHASPRLLLELRAVVGATFDRISASIFSSVALNLTLDDPGTVDAR